MKGLFIPEITAEMFWNGCLESIEKLMAEGEIYDIEYSKWVLCSERLPKHGGRYLISVFDGINRRTTIAPYLPRSKAWTMVGRRAYWKVIAWMPLPEPYKAESEGEERRE